MIAKYDLFNRIEPSNVYLANSNDEILCCFNSIKPNSVSLTRRLNNTYAFNFTIDETVYTNGSSYTADAFDLIGNLMHVYIDNIGWFRMEEPTESHDGYNRTKEIITESIDCELVDKDVFGLKINCGTTDSYEMLADGNVEIDDTGIEHALKQITFYNEENHDLSLMHIVLKFAGIEGWDIGYVDNSLKEYKSFRDGEETTYSVALHDEIGYFDAPSQSVYAFFTQDMAKFFECVITFDIQNRLVNAHRIESVGKNTNVTIGLRNLENTNSMSVDEKSIYTRYRVSGGENLGIEYVNFGNPMIENISFYLNEKYLSAEVIEKYKLWYEYMLSRRIDYATLSRSYNIQLKVVSELRDRLPLDDTSTDWATFSLEDLQNKLSDYQAQKLGIETLFTDADGNVIWAALYASSLADTYKQLVEYIIPNIEIGISNKDAATSDDIVEYRKVEDWTLYGSDELAAKLRMFEGQRETYVANDYNVPYTLDSGHSKDYHEKCYDDFLWLENQLDVNFVDSCAMEYEKRMHEIDVEQELLEQFSLERREIANSVDKLMWKHDGLSFTKEELVALSKLYVDTDYENVNMFLVESDDQVTAIDEQLKLLQAAEEDLSSVSQPQYKYEVELDNFMALYDYKDYVDSLELGDFLLLGVTDEYYSTLRFISITYNPMVQDNNISIEFSNMVRSASTRNDFAQLLDMASQSGKNTIQGGTNSFGNGIVNEGSIQYIMDKIISYGGFKDAISVSVTNNTNVTESITNTITKEVCGWIGVPSGMTELTLDVLTIFKNSAETGDHTVINGGSIITNTITANQIATNAITADKLAANAVTADKITTANITGTNGWINLRSGTFNYGNGSLTWNGTSLGVKGDVNATRITAADSYFIHDSYGTEVKIITLETKYYQAENSREEALTIGIGGATIELKAHNTAGRYDYGEDNIIISSSGQLHVYCPSNFDEGISSTGVYSKVSSSSPNVFIANYPHNPNEGGEFRRSSSSSKRYKHNIQDISDSDINSIYRLPVKTYMYNFDYLDKTDILYGKTIPGFIAEDVEDIIPLAAEYGEYGRVEMWNSKVILPLTVGAVQKNRSEIELLKLEISQMQERVRELEFKSL